jgi:hypothetical protein
LEPEPVEPDRGPVQVQVWSRHSHARFGSQFNVQIIFKNRVEPELNLIYYHKKKKFTLENQKLYSCEIISRSLKVSHDNDDKSRRLVVALSASTTTTASHVG